MAQNNGIPISYIQNYSKSLNMLSESAKGKLETALSGIDYSQDIATIRNAVIGVMQVYCAASATTAARLAADFFDGLRVRSVGEKLGAIITERNPEATSDAVRAFIQILVDKMDDDSRLEFITRCIERMDYETRMAANMCMYENAKRDPLKPKYARIPTSDETCAWCLLLASYGFTSRMAEVVKHTHDNCDCRIVVSWEENPTVSGDEQNQQEYKDLYNEAEKIRASGEMPKELKMRIDAARSKHKANLKSGKVSDRWTTLNELAIIARWLYPGLH